MVLSFGVAAAAGGIGVYNWAANLYSYNRDAWMTDIQVEQEHTYQEDNLKIAMHEMDREEVRDLMQNCINKINNTILVTTLILSLAGEMLFEGQIPADCAPFVLNAYMLCLGSAIFHLVLSILFGLFASSEAYEKSTEFLTQRIKPAWKDNFRKMRHRKREELTQAFEEKDLYTMLKPPLANRAKKAIGKIWNSRRRRQATISAPSERDRGDCDRGDPTSFATVVNEEQGRIWTSFDKDADVEHGCSSRTFTPAEPTEAMGRAKSRPHEYISSNWRQEDWEEAEKDWTHFTSCMFKCVCFGTKNLLEACSYLCIATLYGKYKNAWVFWATQIIFTSLNVLMMHFFICREKERDFPNVPPCIKGCLSHRWASPQLIALIPATGPILVAAAATVPIEAFDRVFIPIGYLSHVVVLCFFFSYLCHSHAVRVMQEGGEEQSLWQDGDDSEQEALASYYSGQLLCCAATGADEEAEVISSEEQQQLPGMSQQEELRPARPSVHFEPFDRGCSESSSAQYASMACLDDSPLATSGDQSGSSRLLNCRGRLRPCRPLELDELPAEGDGEQATHRTSLSARSTRASLGCSDGSSCWQEGGLGQPLMSRTPRTRSRGIFLGNSMTVFPNHVRALPDFMLCRGLFMLVLLWVSALFWALHNAYTKDFRDREKWPEWMEKIFNKPTETLEVETLSFIRPSPYFQPHAVTCPIEGKFFMADSFRVFDLKEGKGAPQKPRPFPCDVNGTIADIAAICDSDGECWPVVLLETQPPAVFDCKRNETWRLLQGATNANRLATRGSGAHEAGLDVLFASEGGQVVQYSRSPARHGFAPEWVVQDHEPEILALDVVDKFLVAFKSNRLVEYQDLETGTVCGRWQIPTDQKVIGGGCARGSTIHILMSEGHSVHIVRSHLPPHNKCRESSTDHANTDHERQHKA